MACITLISDFGLLDASVSVVKGVMLQKLSGVPVIDVTHDIAPYHLQQAAYLLNASYNSFPAGSFHVVLCDIFYIPRPKLLICEKNGHYFISPDNGICSLAFNKDFTRAAVYEMPDSRQNLGSLTAHISGIIGDIINGKDVIAGLPAAEMNNALAVWEPRINGNTVECHIMHIDRFENVIINITKEQFESFRQNRNFRIEFFIDAITEISNHYADVKKGEMLCRFNNAGYMEIAINRDKAASLLGLKLNKEQHLIYRAIKIIFE